MKLELTGEPECRPSTFEVKQWARLDKAITLGIASGSLGCFRELDIQVVISEDWQDAWDLVTVLESLFAPSSESCAMRGLVQNGKVLFRWGVTTARNTDLWGRL
jgi:hypothetical protein